MGFLCPDGSKLGMIPNLECVILGILKLFTLLKSNVKKRNLLMSYVKANPNIKVIPVAINAFRLVVDVGKNEVLQKC